MNRPTTTNDLPTMRPINRSRTAREVIASSVKRRLGDYKAHIAGQGRAERATDLEAAKYHRRMALRELLWARAEIEQAIWQETGGRMGSQYATLATTLQTLPIRGASVVADDND